MNIHISENMESKIDGYTLIPVVQNSIKLNDIPRNSCNNIIVDNVLDSLEQSDRYLQEIASKLSKGGNLMIQGVDIDSACRDYLCKNISISDFKIVLKNKRDYHSVSSVREKLEQTGDVKILSANISKGRYDIRATR